jgi:hypothetical protein
MKKKRISRAQVDRLLDPDNGSATIESLQRIARIVGRELRMQLVRCSSIFFIRGLTCKRDPKSATSAP